HWPDADMLPLGYLGPVPGLGKARETRFTHNEERTFLTLWSMFRSPLMMGGNLTRMDAWTTSLLTNPEVIAVDQHSTGNHAAITTANAVVWVAKATSVKGNYVAVFNIADTPQTLHYTWTGLGLPNGRYKLRDLWAHQNAGVKDAISVTLPAHTCVLYRAEANR
ncbi:MAG: glycoside hydrolase family 27 protein, partial [Terriglobia bacterium]